MSGWILLHRSMLDWEWYDDANTCRLFVHCLLKANHKEKKWKGKSIKRGDFITSLDHLSSELRLSISQVRTSIKKLKSTSEIASKSYSQHTVITVINYDKYQSDSKQNDKHIADESQTNDKPIATTNEFNKLKQLNKENTLVDGKPKTPGCPHQKIIDLYHEFCPTLPRVKIWSGTREKHLRARWREKPEFQKMSFWNKYFEYANQSDHLTGNNDRGWTATLGWLVNPTNFAKVIEGNYENRKKT